VDLQNIRFNMMITAAVNILDEAFLTNREYRSYLTQRGVYKEILVKITKLISSKDLPTLHQLGLYKTEEYLERLVATPNTQIEQLLGWEMEDILTARKIARFYNKNRQKVDNVELTPQDRDEIHRTIIQLRQLDDYDPEDDDSEDDLYGPVGFI
jgi:hypothetical protein